MILYDGARREVASISEKSISLKNLDAPDFGGILTGTSDVLAYDGWLEDMERKGFEVLSKSKPVPEASKPITDDKLHAQKQEERVDTSVNFTPELTEKAKKSGQMSRPEQLYRQLSEMYPQLVSGEHTYEHYEADPDSGYEPLSIEQIGERLYSFMATYIQNGDMDEASPHLHINFVPFYTKGRKNGLSKGVSMKQALIEEGFKPKTTKDNQLVMWEEAERREMERILHRHGFVREDKNAHYAHMTVEDFKYSQDLKKLQAQLRDANTVTEMDHEEKSIRRLKDRLAALEHETAKLKKEKRSPYKAFFYTLPEKQAYVQAKLDALQIPYRETENGLEAQECYVDQIRKIEKEYSPKTNQREKLRNDIDRLLMQSKDFEELLDRLHTAGYEVKQGKYISVKPKHGGSFLRLKGLGEYYSEQALRNRFAAKARYEQQLAQRAADARRQSAPNAVEKVFGGTYVQSLATEERQRREAQYIPNGIKFANGEGI